MTVFFSMAFEPSICIDKQSMIGAKKSGQKRAEKAELGGKKDRFRGLSFPAGKLLPSGIRQMA